MEITISGVPEYANPNMDTKPNFGDVVMYENGKVSEILKSLGEDESCFTNIRRLMKFNLVNHKHRLLLVTFNKTWVVRNILSRTYRLKENKESNKTNIYVNRYLSKEDQQKKKIVLANDGN